MRLTELLRELQRRKIHLYIQDGQLRCKSPRGALSLELRSAIEAYNSDIRAFLSPASRELPPIMPIPRTGPLPLSFAQQRLWFLDQLNPGSTVYNIPIAVQLTGDLDAAALERSFNELVSRHEILRTTYRMEGDQAVQHVAAGLVLPFHVQDLRNLSAECCPDAVHKIALEEAQRPFDLSSGPMLRMRLLILPPRNGLPEHVLVIVFHHIVTDDWSSALFFKELGIIYAAFAAGQSLPLPPPRLQYADFAVAQREWLQGAVLEEHLDYWKKKLAGGVPTLELPTNRIKPGTTKQQGAELHFDVPNPVLRGLRQLGQTEGMTQFVILVAAFYALLHRYTGQKDISIGTSIANRNWLDTEGIMGFFVNTLVLRADLSDDPRFSEILTQLQTITLEAQSHQDLPFERLVEALRPAARDADQAPLFQVMLVFHNMGFENLVIPGLELRPLGGIKRNAVFDLVLHIADNGDSFHGWLEYETTAFDADTVARMARHFQGLLESIACDPHQRLSELPLLTSSERQTLLVDWNATEAQCPKDCCLHELFEAQAARTPAATAVICDDEKLSYAELNARANQLAHVLRSRGVAPESRVGLSIEHCVDMVVGILAILKAGGAYVPIDVAYPQERVAYMLADAGIGLLVTKEVLSGWLPKTGIDMLCFDRDRGSIAAQNTGNLQSEVKAEHAAYVIYTSGSTGRPKGVWVSHANAVHSTVARTEFYPQPLRGFLLLSSFAFDSSIAGIFWTLSQGGVLCVPEDGAKLDPLKLAQLIRNHNLSHLLCLPTFYNLLLDQFDTNLAEPLRVIMVGGDVCTPEIAARHYARLPSALLYNEYGPTETTVWCTSHLVQPSEADLNISIGRPIANTSLYLLDTNLNPVPIGVAGELYIGGMGLTRGYLNRSDLTAERFVPNPFGGVGQRLYRTGDLARYRPDGNIECLGRIDHQVKIRGFRIELGEIEAALSRIADVHDAVVVAREDIPGEKRLVAYMVSENGAELAIAQLRAALQRELPDYMVPSAFVMLDTLPLTSNGKVDRKALPVPDAMELPQTDFIAPRTLTEELLSELWARILGLERVGIENNFFELGGHSLLATQMVSRIRRIFDIDLPLRNLFESPTVAALARRIETARADDDWQRKTPPLMAVAREGVFPLSFAQQRLWFLDRLEPDNSFYCIPAAVRLTGDFDVGALEASLRGVIQRHEVLRTTFSAEAGQPMQTFVDAFDLPLSRVDLRGLSAEKRETELFRLVEAEAQRPFDLVRGPLLRVTLLELSEDQHVLAFMLHHIISDGWSTDILIRDFAALYTAFSHGQQAGLPELPIQYADFSCWQRGWLQGEVLESQLSYWRRQLEGAPPVLDFPTDRPRPTMQSYRGATFHFEVTKAVTHGLRALGREAGGTLFMVLLAAFKVLLMRYSGQHDLCVGSPIANRTQIETEGLIGFFVNTLVLRTDLSGNPAFSTLLSRVRETALQAQAHQDLPFEKLVEELQPVRDLSHSPLFQVMFVMQNAPQRVLDLPGLRVEPLAVESGAANFDLTLELTETAEGLSGSIEYATDLFDPSTVARLARHYCALLKRVVANPESRVGELPMLSASERHCHLEEWNATAHDYGEPCDLVGRFEAQVLKSPAAVAASCGGVTLSYQALNEKANRLAHALIGEGVGPDGVVALLDERGLDFLAMMLAIFKAGAAYLPLDPAHPDGRIAQVLEESHVSLLLAGAACRERAAAIVAAMSEPKPRLLDLAACDARESCRENPPRRHRPQNLAFVIYTSGSTGKPKGAIVEHQGMFNNLITKVPALELTALDVIAQTASQCFDISVWQFLTALTLGARVEIFPDAISRDPQRLLEEIAARGVTVLEAVPSMIRALLDASESGAAFAGLRWLLPCGEAFAPELCRRFMERHPHVRLLNAYGPAECSDDVSYYPILTPPGGNDLSVPIGRPVDNTRLYLLNRWLEPVPVGAPGEICVGGVQVGRGYLNRPDLTAAAFLPDPFGPPGTRLYHTGDLGRYRADGVIEFLGRVDHQVKIRGHRIEPGEVEACLATHPRVHATAVVARLAGPGLYRLVAYVVGAVEAEELRQHLRATLPDYMIPAAFVSLDTLPLTPNGKVDRNALPEPDLSAQLARRFMAPRTPTEKILAQIWADVLRVERVGINDNFFELGGHSLMAITLIERMRRHGLQADVRALFMNPTPAELAAVVGDGAEIVFPPNLIPVGCDSIRPEMLPLVELTQTDIDRIVEGIPGGASNVQDIYPLAPLQEGMLFHHLMATEGDPYQLVTLLAFDLRERLEDFLRALQVVITRHDILRTSLAWDGLSEPVQVVWRETPLIVENVTLDPAAGDIAIQMLARYDPSQYRFDVRQAPLMRGFITNDIGKDRWLLLLSLHHLASDHTTDEILVAEAYAHLMGQADRLPVPVPFRNFVAHARLGVSKQEHEAFFRGILSDVTEPTAPFGLLDVQGNGTDTKEARLSLDAVLARRLREQARLLGVSAASLCHQAWAQVLARVSSRDDVVFGTVLFGRMHGGAGTDRVLGPFINTLPVRVQLGADSAAGSVRRMHRLLTELLRHEHASLALAQRCSAVPAPAPLFSALLNYRHSPAPVKGPGEVPATWDGVEILYAQERTNYPLVLSVDDFGEGFQITAQTRNPLDPDRVCGFMRVALERLVEALETAPDATIKAIDVLPETERHQLLSEWNDTSTEYPKDRCIHELFEAQVERTPQAVAVVFGDQRLTYAELNNRANELAHRLRDLGVGPEIVVGICVERSVEMLVGLLGILKAGGAYLPLDADYPRERRAFMIEDSGPLLVLTQKHLRESLSESVPTLYLDADWASINNAGWTNPARCARSANLAYITYTSGSTGRPKGVGAVHEGVVRLLKNTNYVRFNNPDETILHYAPLAFDASTFELWAPLLNGARLIIAPPGPQLALDDLGRVVREYGVTTLWLTAALFRRMVDYRLSDLAGVKQLLTGGDVVSPQHARKFCDAFPTNVLINGYGPTENTTFSTFYILSDLSESGSLPIGKPIANSRAYILDRNFNVAPIGVVGELHVAGPGLARGYVSRPDLTAERFVPDPFDATGGRLYRTGDMARYRQDGNIEFLGRIDQQVKVRGFRIELGEIEAAFSQIPQVQEAVVLAQEDQPGDKRLIAYVVRKDGVELAMVDLRILLQQHLPDYMVPSVFVFLDALPLTSNGKVDSKALPAPDARDVAHVDYVAPRTRVEEILADIFAQVLSLEQVSIHADFFYLGGHSLIAFALAHRICEALRCKLPLMAIFQSPSVAQLANYIEQNHVNLCRNPVVLREGENAPPLYCVHPAGSVACYLPLARHMGGKFPIHGIDSHVILDPRFQKRSISTMAAEYSELIRKQSPHGPYRLLGWSMGGLIAHAIAADLESHGERVAFLGMLDVSLRSEVNDDERFELFAGYLNRYPEDRKAFLQMNMDERRDLTESTEHMSHEEWFLYVVAYGQARGKWLRDISLNLLKSLFTEWWDGITLTNAHTPPCIHANMRVWWARDSLDESGRPPVNWGHYTFGATSIEVIEGNHETIVHDVNVITSIERYLRDGKLT